MKKVLKVFLVLAVICSVTQAQQNYVGWSTGYLSGWAGISATTIKWKAYTHMCLFSATPSGAGGCNLAMGLNDNSVNSAIAEGHKNNVKVLLCVGGAGTGGGFVTSTANATVRATFITNMINLMKKYGFDGLDMDWEELNGKNAEYVALHKELRLALDKITPRPLLTAAIAGWMFNSTTAQISSSMDQMNNMSYWTRIINNNVISESAISGDMMDLVNKGCPKAKLGVGIGLDYEEGNPEVDCDPKACGAKCRFAIKQGYGGVMEWAIEKDRKKFNGAEPCHDTIALYVNKTITGIAQPRFVMSGDAGAMNVLRDRYTGHYQVSYSLASSSPIDLSVYNVNGTLVKTLIHGQSDAGFSLVPLDAFVGAGTYVVRLSSGTKVQTAKAIVIK
jgi:chitinase